MRIVIETDDLEEGDIELLKKESAKAKVMNISVGRPLSERQSEIVRMFGVHIDKFKISFEDGGK